jgi:ADP-heptose:LPS heptosyltransferase
MNQQNAPNTRMRIRLVFQAIRDRWLRWQNEGLLSELTKPLVKPNAGNLVVLPLGVGDYLLARMYLPYLRTIYPNERITWLAFTPLKSLIEAFDAGVADDVLYVDEAAFLSSQSIRKAWLLRLRWAGYSRVLHPLWTRYANFDDLLARAAVGEERIAWAATATNPPAQLTRPVGAEHYTTLFPAVSTWAHELAHYRAFFSRLTGECLPLHAPHIAVDTIMLQPEAIPQQPYVVLAPGARFAYRQWPIEHYAAVADALHERGLHTVLVGGAADRPLGEALARLCRAARPQDLIGRLTWPQTAKILHQARLTVCGDTGTLHLALSVQCPAVCVSNGNHYKRFVPYPNELQLPLSVVLPPNLNLEDEAFWHSLYQRSYLDIRDVRYDDVWQAICQHLEGSQQS